MRTSRFLRIAVSAGFCAAAAAGCMQGGAGRSAGSGVGPAAAPPHAALPGPTPAWFRAAGGPGGALRSVEADRLVEPARAAAEPGRTGALAGPPVAGPPVAGPVAVPGRAEAEPAPEPGGGAKAPRTAYLTFDDGPSGLTPQVLSILRRENIRATFFVTGAGLEQHRELIREMAAEGHALGNHSFSHDYRLYRNEDGFMEDVHKLDRALQELTGSAPEVLRFPGGSNTRLGRTKGSPWLMPRLVRRVREEGYQYFDWNVSSTDAAQAVQPKEEIVGAVLSAAANKTTAIVLMHDAPGKTTTVEALPEVIRGLRKLGFRFEVLDKNSHAVHFLE